MDEEKKYLKFIDLKEGDWIYDRNERRYNKIVEIDHLGHIALEFKPNSKENERKFLYQDNRFIQPDIITRRYLECKMKTFKYIFNNPKMGKENKEATTLEILYATTHFDIFEEIMFGKKII